MMGNLFLDSFSTSFLNDRDFWKEFNRKMMECIQPLMEEKSKDVNLFNEHRCNCDKCNGKCSCNTQDFNDDKLIDLELDGDLIPTSFEQEPLDEWLKFPEYFSYVTMLPNSIGKKNVNITLWNDREVRVSYNQTLHEADNYNSYTSTISGDKIIQLPKGANPYSLSATMNDNVLTLDVKVYDEDSDISRVIEIN